jgi:hypothetical protein
MFFRLKLALDREVGNFLQAVMKIFGIGIEEEE